MRKRKKTTYTPKPVLPEELAFHQDVYAVCQRHFPSVLDETFDTVAFVTEIADVMRHHMTRIATETIDAALTEEWKEYEPFLAERNYWRDAMLERFREYLEPYLVQYKANLAEQNAQIIVQFPHLPTRAEYLCGIQRIQAIAITETTWALSRAQEAVSSVFNDVMNEVQGWLASSSAQS